MTIGRVAYRPPQMTLAQRRAASERSLALMRGRRSIRDFSTRPVPRGLVVNAIQAAALAPSVRMAFETVAEQGEGHGG